MITYLYTPKTCSKITTAPADTATPNLQVVTWRNGSHHVVWGAGTTLLTFAAEGSARSALLALLGSFRYSDHDGDERGISYLHADERGTHYLWLYSCQAPAVWRQIERRIRYGVRSAERLVLLGVQQAADDPHPWEHTVLLPEGEGRWDAPDMSGASFHPSEYRPVPSEVPTYEDQTPVETWGDWYPAVLVAALEVWADKAGTDIASAAAAVRQADWGDGCSLAEYLAERGYVLAST